MYVRLKLRVKKMMHCCDSTLLYISLFCLCYPKKKILSLSSVRAKERFFFLSLAEKEGFVGVSVVTTTRTFFSQSSVNK